MEQAIPATLNGIQIFDKLVEAIVHAKDKDTDADVNGKLELYDDRKAPTDPPLPQNGYTTSTKFNYIFRHHDMNG